MHLKSTRLSLAFLFIGCYLLSGCGFQPLAYFNRMERAPGKDSTSKLFEGDRNFLDGDYGEAERIYENLLDDDNSLAARGALYGLACTRFMLAESPEEQREAAGLLERWRVLSSEPFSPENPRILFTVFLKAMSGQYANEDEESATIELSESPLLMRFLDYEMENDDLKQRLIDMTARLQAAESENGALEETMKRELERLRKQIRTIESIDQKIQEKKQGISSP